MTQLPPLAMSNNAIGFKLMLINAPIVVYANALVVHVRFVDRWFYN